MINSYKKVFCQGVKGAYSHIACKEIFGNIEPVFMRSFAEVCKMVKESKGAGVLPFENSTAGIVNGVIDLLMKYGLNIIYAKTIAVRHNLCALPDTDINQVKTIYSHQQALQQCSEYLNTLECQQIETVNTAASAKMASEQKGAGAVCSKEAAQIYGLEVIKENICNTVANSTRFVVVANESYIGNANITSLYFKTKNQSGALYNILKIFSDFGVNLCSLHSLPLEEETWHYGFYVDIEGNLQQKNISDCIKAVKNRAEYLHIFGSYISI